MAVNDDLSDDAIRRAAMLERRINGIWSELLPILREVERDLIAKIEAGIGPRGGSFQAQRAQRVLREVRRIIEGGAAELEKRLIEKGLEAGEVEAAAAARSLENRVPIGIDWETPSARLLQSVTVGAPFTDQGALLESFIRGWSRQSIEQVQGQIRIGLVEGEGVEPIARRVRRVQGVSQKKARTIVRTYANHVMTQARSETYKANSDVILAEQWVSTLDHRTCPECGALDNKTFDLGTGPQPPRHPNCRCVRVPITKGREALIKAGVIKEGTRAARNSEGLTGEVPASQAFPDWLKRQPERVQKDVLGETRFQMFKRGVKFDKFVNDEGQIMTLEELRKRL